MILGDNREECLKDNLKTLKIRVLWQEELAIEKYEDLDAFGVLAAYVATTENRNLKDLFKKLKQPKVKAAMVAKRLAKEAQLDTSCESEVLEGKKSYTLILKSMFTVLIFFFHFLNNLITFSER